MRVRNNYPVTSIADNLPFFGLEGTYVSSGWAVSVGESGSAIELEVDAGDGYLENSALSTTAQTVTLSSGDPDYPRRDVIYVASDETIGVLQGEPQKPPSDESGDLLGPQNAPKPAPNSAESLSGIPIAHCWVPAGAADTSDIQQDYIFDLRVWVDISGATSSTDRRYATIGPVALDDGDTADAPLTVDNGDTIRVVEWGASLYDNGSKSDPPAGVRVKLATPSGGTASSEETALTRDETGIVEEDATDAGANHYSLRLENASGTDYQSVDGQGLGAQFVVEIV
ncbi:hypothetical protein JMJ58_14915 [Haloterrigena salifodinae]|uniref:Uncharacterized protein n=1 Tax=Haloterrigena salifodinae TaxID=2675099 RepID=A0A8T8DXM0_9EURY|nr:hypothetical protein [Haloterrigena salifodinae]QRV14225.1 hypothetical protein JMJ58_14915 [Haloterrigena salifodinae]